MSDPLYTPDWAKVGGPALVVNVGNGWGVPTVRAVTIEKITSTQIVVSDGTRYRKARFKSETKQLEQVGGSYYSDDLISAEDPRLPLWKKQAELRDMKHEVKQAIKAFEYNPDIEKAAALKEVLNGWITLTAQVKEQEAND